MVRNIAAAKGWSTRRSPRRHQLLNTPSRRFHAVGGRPLTDDECRRRGRRIPRRAHGDGAINNGRRSVDQSRDACTVLQRARTAVLRGRPKGFSWPGLGEADRRRRAQLILLANMRLLAYEQKRVQPVLERNLAYVPDAVRAWLGGELMGRNTLLDRMVRRLQDAGTAETDVRETFQIAATRGVYSMVVGTEELRVRSRPSHAASRQPCCCELASPRQDRRRYGPGRSSRTTSRTCSGGRCGPSCSVTTGPRRGCPHGRRQLAALRRAPELPRQPVPVPPAAERPYEPPRSTRPLPVALSRCSSCRPCPTPSPAQQALADFDGREPMSRPHSWTTTSWANWPTRGRARRRRRRRRQVVDLAPPSGRAIRTGTIGRARLPRLCARSENRATMHAPVEAFVRGGCRDRPHDPAELVHHAQDSSRSTASLSSPRSSWRRCPRPTWGAAGCRSLDMTGELVSQLEPAHPGDRPVPDQRHDPAIRPWRRRTGPTFTMARPEPRVRRVRLTHSAVRWL